MRIGLYHGFELTGSGSNEYNRYLAKVLCESGHEVHIICREKDPTHLPFVTQCVTWEKSGESNYQQLQSHQHTCILHQLPSTDVNPVYVTDKQRPGNVKTFVSLSDDELRDYHELNEKILTKILSEYPLDILHANHLVYQPMPSIKACQETSTPFIIFPHGSSIEYTVRHHERYHQLAKTAIEACNGLIIGNTEVRDRIIDVYPEMLKTVLEKTQIVGVGVDTSLFKPVEKSQREESINTLILKSKNMQNGKSPQQSLDLFNRVEKEGVAAIQHFKKKYNLSFPDTNLTEQLENIPWEENILLYVGALTVGKGLQSLIVSLPEIIQSHPKSHLVIVGSGDYREVLETLVYALSTSNKSLLDELCEKADELAGGETQGLWNEIHLFLKDKNNLKKLLKNGKNIDQHIHFLGRLDHNLLPHLFPCADLAVFPSVIPEAYPLVLMESLSNGVLPVVSYFSGFKDGIDELVPHLGSEIVDKMKIPMDPIIRITQLSQKINALLSTPTKNQNGLLLREIATENYDWNLRAKQLVDAYENVVGQPVLANETPTP